MRTETVNLLKPLTNHLRITSIALFIISVYLAIPKNVSTTQAINSLAVHDLSSSQEELTMPRANSQEFAQTYIPPNYGAPDSQHGTGTR
jgi:hypothetical protein